MLGIVCNLARDPAGKLIIGLAAAAVFTVAYWHFFEVSYATKLIFGLAIMVEGYRFFKYKTPA